MKKSKGALVTGAGGFIGSHLCEGLIARGYAVRALIRYNSRNSWGWLENCASKKKIEIAIGDIRNYDSVVAAMAGMDTVFHLAALIGIPYSYYSPDSYLDTNMKGTLNILQAAKELRLKRVIHTSTSEIYGTAQYVPITETHPVNPQSPYAASKASADFMALSFYRAFGVPGIVVRPFNTYGPRQSSRAVIPTIISQILSGTRIIKLGSLYPTRDLTYVADTVEGFIRAAETDSAKGEVINLGSNTEISIGDLAYLIAKIMRVKIKIKFDAGRKRPEKSEVVRLLADNQKARQLLGWVPRFSLEEGLGCTIKWLRKNQDSYKPQIYNV